MSHVRIIGTTDCGIERCEAFKLQIKQHDVLCRRDYAERIISILAHTIQFDYYSDNQSVSIVGFLLEHLSDLNQTSSSLISETVS